MTMLPSADLTFAIETARAAGQRLVAQFTSPPSARFKGYRDFVTDVDLSSQAFLMERLRARYPDHAIWGEEGERPSLLDDHVWVLDPLDGTNNYAHGIPLFAITLALVEQNRARLGVVYDPLRDQLFCAEQGQGAWLNGRRLQVSQTAEVGRALIGIDWGRSPEEREASLRLARALGEKVQSLRSFGSAALSICYVAAGWLDAHFSMHVWPWDVLAATLCVHEAGGRSGSLWHPTDDWREAHAIAVSNAHLYDPLLALAGAVMTP